MAHVKNIPYTILEGLININGLHEKGKFQKVCQRDSMIRAV